MKIIFEQPIPLSYKRDFEERVLVVSEDLEKINYLTDENNLLGVDLLLKNSETCDFDKIKNTILRVVADVFLSSKKIIHNVIYENNVTDLSYNDPHESLIDNREIIQTGSGQFIFQGNFLKIINNLYTLFKTEFINMGCN